MFPVYEEKKDKLYLIEKKSRHEAPHLHNSIEFIYITEGTMEVGMGQTLFHMEKGDFAVIFPDVIHHAQVFGAGENRCCHVWAQAALSGPYEDIIMKCCPENPVIKNVHEDIHYIMQAMIRHENQGIHNASVERPYIEILLARSIPGFYLNEKKALESNDLIYQTVSYIAKHFREYLTLETLAKDLGVNKFTLSKVFSGTFHTNFNQYVNAQRVMYACTFLENSNKSITDISLDAGFESQRTFNRVFKTYLKMTPREYRDQKRGTRLF